MTRYVYFYFMKNEPAEIRKSAPAHVTYWHNLNLPDYQGGPFADRSGGLISFSAQDLATASQLVQNDPFTKHNLLDSSWLKEWHVE